MCSSAPMSYQWELVYTANKLSPYQFSNFYMRQEKKNTNFIFLSQKIHFLSFFLFFFQPAESLKQPKIRNSFILIPKSPWILVSVLGLECKDFSLSFSFFRLLIDVSNSCPFSKPINSSFKSYGSLLGATQFQKITMPAKRQLMPGDQRQRFE